MKTRAFFAVFVLGALSIGYFSGRVYAAEFSIVSAQTTLKEKVYYLNAQINYEFNEKMLEVLHKGVPITIELNIELTRSRDYIWDETVASLVQKYQLEYHALTKQHITTNLNSGLQYSFPSLDTAISVLGIIIDLPILDKSLLIPDETYTVNLRVQHDIDELPVPLRLRAYVSSGWRISSEWYSWLLDY